MLPPPLLLLLVLQPILSSAMPPEWNLPSMPTSWVLPSGNSHRCVPIPKSMELCSNIGYTEMRLPNMLNHDTVNEVLEQTKHWVPLAKLACHKEIRVLLCSIYAPVCIPQLLDRQIKPCRSLCDAVMRPCATVMKSFGFAWPEILNCTQFPPETDLMCIQSTKDIRTESNATADCQACPENVTYESIIGNYCVNKVVFKARVESITAESDRIRIRLKRRVRFFKSAGLSRQQKRSIRSVVVDTSGDCKCRSLEAARADPSKKLLMMGSLSPDGGSFSVSYLVEWQQRSRPFKRAMRKIRGGGGKRNRGRAGAGRSTGSGSSGGGGGGGDEGGGDGDASLCRVSQLHEPLPTALPSASSSSGSNEGGGGNRRKRKNRRKKNGKVKRTRKNNPRDRSASATAGSEAGDVAVEGEVGREAAASAAEGGARQRRQRRNRADGDRRRSGYAYDTFYYTNYSQS